MNDSMTTPEAQEDGPATTAEEYAVWKKNTPFLYDLVVTHALTWPSLTCEWLPEVHTLDDGCREGRLLLGTHAGDGEPNAVLVMKARLPGDDTEISTNHFDEERGELGSYGGRSAKLTVCASFGHPGEVNRARYMPQDSLIVATKTNTGAVNVYDRSRVRAFETAVAEPVAVCLGHAKEGYAIDWSTLARGDLLSGADDGSLCLWKLDAPLAAMDEQTATSTAVQPFTTFDNMGAGVGDVSFHRTHPYLLAAGAFAPEACVAVYDVRASTAPSKRFKTQESGDVNAVEFSPHDDRVFLTGSGDSVVRLWDLRNGSRPLCEFEGHADEVFTLEWSPTDKGRFLSSGADARVVVWDMARIGEQQTPEDAEDGPPEMVFRHGGHTSRVSDASFSRTEPNTVASVADDNALHIWRPQRGLFDEEFAARAEGARELPRLEE